MKNRSLAVLFLPALALSFVATCSGQSSSLVDAPLPVEAGAAAQPGDPSGASYAIARTPEVRETRPGLRPFDWSMIGAAATLRVLDFTSTEKALTEPQTFHEAMLPNALVKNKPAFAAFQAGTVGLNYVAYRFLVRHDKRSLARASQYLYVGIMTFQVSHNYQLLGNAPAN